MTAFYGAETESVLTAYRVNCRRGDPPSMVSGAAGWCGGHHDLLGQAGGASWGWLDFTMAPVKPSKNVTLALPVEPFDM